MVSLSCDDGRARRQVAVTTPRRVGGIKAIPRKHTVLPQDVLRQHCYDLGARQREAHALVRTHAHEAFRCVVAQVEPVVTGDIPHFTIFSDEVWRWCGDGSWSCSAIEVYETLGRGSNGNKPQGT